MFGRGGAGAAADEHHQVGGGDDLAGGHHAAIGADHTGRELETVGHRAFAADRGADRRVEQQRQAGQVVAAAGGHHAAAADEHRLAGRQQGARSPFEVIGRRPGAPVGPASQLGLSPKLRGIDRLLLDVEGHAEMGRAGAARGAGAKRGAHLVADLRGGIQRAVPLGEGAVQRLLIELGQRVAAARGDRHIGREAQYRHRGFVGFDQARQQVGRAAAAGSFAHADAAADPGVGIGHVRGAAFVARQHVRDAVIQAVQRVVVGQAGIAADAEDMAHAMQLQHADQGFGAVGGVGGGRGRVRGRVGGGHAANIAADRPRRISRRRPLRRRARRPGWPERPSAPRSMPGGRRPLRPAPASLRAGAS